MSTLSDDPYGQISVSLSQGRKTVSAAGTPERLVASDTFVEAVELHPRKNDTTANAGVVMVGFSSTGGQNYRVLAAGDPGWTISAVSGKKLNLKEIWVDAATNGDGVTYSAIN